MFNMCSAVRTLKSVDAIFAEDCRRTGKLATHFGIRTRLVSYHAHNEAKREGELLSYLARGLTVALVSDAGTPGVSDPGAAAVTAAVRKGYDVVPIPGPAAAITALAASGLPTEMFLFLGFLPPKSATRRKRLETLRATVTVRTCAAEPILCLHIARNMFSALRLPRAQKDAGVRSRNDV
jgi:16S rRNA (cytidine1402-2'-O)-methyltransferase